MIYIHSCGFCVFHVFLYRYIFSTSYGPTKLYSSFYVLSVRISFYYDLYSVFIIIIIVKTDCLEFDKKAKSSVNVIAKRVRLPIASWRHVYTIMQLTKIAHFYLTKSNII